MSFFLFFCLETKEPKIQDFGYFAKNQMNFTENLQTRFAQTMDIFHAPFIDFFNASSPRS
ncbi:Hypothetical protein Ccan_22060 [Capnocytophaga canimorsus Cc5]|uniref:Uncharacterized protein n=1 Tax=Capnocytophaga canimorsus (strain 5) TaxID=860228 RepID=F9YV12_CAPCC|nr:Hypothetical protein Ccan_22060 [Capnocytophaga canimorsus Cc5]